MNTREIKEFFNRLAPTWDASTTHNTAVIEKILDNANIGAGQSVLDVACGTGVLFEHYLKRGVSSVTAIDFSEGMTKIASEKFAREPKISVLCADAAQADFRQSFDSVMIYNAFPHFIGQELLLHRLGGFVKHGGRLTVAHGMSRERLNMHHNGAALGVSSELLEAEQLKALFPEDFSVDVVISDGEMYEVSGKKR